MTTSQPNPWAIAEATPLDGVEHVTRIGRVYQGGCHYAQYLEHTPDQPKTLVAAIGTDEAYRYELAELPGYEIPTDMREEHSLGEHAAWDIEHDATGNGGLLVIWDETTGQTAAYGVGEIGHNIWFSGFDGTCPDCGTVTNHSPEHLPLTEESDVEYCPPCAA